MYKVVVEYEYIAKEADELTIRKGDIITDVVRKPGGWWEGVLKDKKGMFPDNFVRPLDKDRSVSLRNQKDVSRTRQCKVIFSYNQDHEDELNLKVGDIIDIVGEEEEGWWRGTLNGKEGVFPSNFVRELTWQPSPSIRVISNNLENENESKVPKLPEKPSKQLCEATYPYKAQNEDELSFEEGDIITICNKGSQDPGWWQGELNGKIGVFPDNFVVLISDNKISSKENRKSVAEKGAIKSVSVASQRKSLDIKKELVSSVNQELSALGLISEIKKKIEDAVDGSTGSKHVSLSVESYTSTSDNAFDHIERRSLLTDVRATRAKAPGRRPPTSSIHKEDLSGISQDNTNLQLHTNEEEPPANVNIKPTLREWEKHKAPWLEEMKKSQVRRTMTSTLEENLFETEGNIKVEKTKSPHEDKSSIDLAKTVELNHEPPKHSVTHNAKDIPESTNRVLFKESSPATEPKPDKYADILERLGRLENIVQKQSNTIAELKNTLQMEKDLRILLQDKVQKLHT